MCLKPKVKKMGWFVRTITFGWAAAITLAPFGIYMKEQYLSWLWMQNHEKIHWRQQMEMLIIFFYLWYGIEWFIRIFVNGKKAYVSLSFERESNANEYDFNYLNNRKPYSWLKYMKEKK